jgi:hypothetical protein
VIEDFLKRVVRWAAARPDVRAAALVGSVARGDARPDSDVDVVLLVDDPARYVERDDWIAELGGVRLLRTQQWGDITERRFALEDGTEVDCGIGAPGWNGLPEMRMLYDPDGFLAARSGPRGRRPAQT